MTKEEIMFSALNGNLLDIDYALLKFGDRMSKEYDEKITRTIWDYLNKISRTDSDALCLLGTRNLYGHPFGRMEQKGLSQIFLAAEKGSRCARHSVALFKYWGFHGIHRDRTEAFVILKKLIEEGYPAAEEAYSQLKEMSAFDRE